MIWDYYLLLYKIVTVLYYPKGMLKSLIRIVIYRAIRIRILMTSFVFDYVKTCNKININHHTKPLRFLFSSSTLKGEWRLYTIEMEFQRRQQPRGLRLIKVMRFQKYWNRRLYICLENSCRRGVGPFLQDTAGDIFLNKSLLLLPQ